MQCSKMQCSKMGFSTNWNRFARQKGRRPCTTVHTACKMAFSKNCDFFLVRRGRLLYTRPTRWYFRKNCDFFWSGGGDGPAQGLQDVQRQGCPEADRLHRQQDGDRHQGLHQRGEFQGIGVHKISILKGKPRKINQL